MLDIKFIRENPDLVKSAARRKHFDCDVDTLLQLDADALKLRQQLQDIATEKNAKGKQIGKLPNDEKQAALAELSDLKDREKQLQADLADLEPKIESLLLQVPQIPADDVPDGKDEAENVELRKVGEVRTFDFEPKDHVELGTSLGMIDVERGVKLAGSRSYFLIGDGALLHWAVLRYAMDFMVTQRGYTPLSVPVIVRDEAMRGTAYFPGGEEQAYRLERDELNLVGTAEVPVTAFHSGETLGEDDLPRRYCAWSSCFRREAGTYGKDTHGLFRIHQFDKVEQVVVCRDDVDESVQFHEEILNNSEQVLQALGLPYRVVLVCAGDLGRGQVKKFDLETWMPSRGAYCETHSASRFYDFQARRMNLRYRDGDRKIHYCHTLNNTVIASPRILIPIMELYQNADGSITIPEVLRPYMQNRERIEPSA